ncbi:MAG: CHAT domain-containing protein, partial [Bacteroidia bacterium]
MLRQIFVWALVVGFIPITKAQTPHVSKAVDRYLENAYAFFDQGQLDSAAFYFGQVMYAHLELDELIPTLDAGIATISCYYHLREFSKMKKILSLIAPLLQNKFAEKYDYLSTFYNLKGACHEALGEYQLGLETSLLGLQIASENNPESSSLATENNNVGILYFRMGDFQSAMQYFQEALVLTQQNDAISDRQNYQIYNNIATVYLKTNRFKRAMTYLSQARTFLNRDEASSPHDSIDLFNNLGLVFTELTQWDSAFYYLNQAEQIQKSVPQGVARTYHNLGHTYREAGDAPKAIAYLELALSHNLESFHDYHPNLAKQYRMLGEIYLEAGLAERSLSYLQKSLNTLVPGFRSTDYLDNPRLDKVSSYPNLLRTLRDKAVALRLYAIEKDSSIIYLNSALETSLLAAALVEKMRFQFAKLNSREYWYDWAFAVYEQGIENVRLCLQQNDDPKYLEAAFLFFEQSKAISLLRATNDQAVKSKWPIPDSLADQERGFRLKINFLQEQWHRASEKGDLALANRHLNQLDTLKTQLDSLMSLFNQKYPAYFRLNYQSPQNKIVEGQALAKSKNLDIIEYFWGEEHLYAFVISPDTLRLHRIAPTASIEPILNRVLAQIRTMPDPMAFTNAALQSYSHDSQKLFELLLNSLDIKDSGLLLLIPDGPLSYLPFESLLKASSLAKDYQSLPYLFLSYQISYAYSLNFYFHQTQDILVNEHKACLALAPSYSSELMTDLPYALDELAAINEFWDGAFLIGNEASKANFLAEFDSYSILHLAMHAASDTTRFLYDRLIFQTDLQTTIEAATLYAAEISSLSIQSDLVVLSACETGVGKFKQGEGVFSLGRAFRIAGVRAVLMSLWKVEDQSTAKLMKHFYASLAQGKSKSEALQLARQSYLFEAQGLNAHPYYWSSFILNGDSAPLKSGRNSYTLFFSALFLVGIVFFIFMQARSIKS